MAVSSFYLTEPVDMPPQPWFINCAAQIDVVLSPRELLRLSQQVEAELGRKTKGDLRPRPIDIDLLFHDQRVMDRRDLQLPHPRIAEREFVLRPLNEIASHHTHPITGKSVREMLTALEKREKKGTIIRLYSPVSHVVEAISLNI
jgi:2-amino-4-hydroxy-6-hydroxymethyldihydropteridine diphosphokinase